MHETTSKAALCGLLILFSATGAATQPQPPVCAEARHREFDFWAGTWSVRNAGGNLAGVNVITIEQGGCVLVERWTAAKGGTGQSLNYYDPATGKWKQRWVGLGLILEMQGGLTDGALVMEGPLHYVQQQRTTLLRGTWTPLADGRVRQHFVESVDGGKTWADWFDGYYSRDSAANPAPP